MAFEAPKDEIGCATRHFQKLEAKRAKRMKYDARLNCLVRADIHSDRLQILKSVCQDRGIREEHTHISWALEAGESSSDIASWVGASLATIEAHYRHAKPRTKMSWLDDLDSDWNTTGTKRNKESLILERETGFEPATTSRAS